MATSPDFPVLLDSQYFKKLQNFELTEIQEEIICQCHEFTIFSENEEFLMKDTISEICIISDQESDEGISSGGDSEENEIKICKNFDEIHHISDQESGSFDEENELFNEENESFDERNESLHKENESFNEENESFHEESESSDDETSDFNSSDAENESFFYEFCEYSEVYSSNEENEFLSESSEFSDEESFIFPENWQNQAVEVQSLPEVYSGDFDNISCLNI